MAPVNSRLPILWIGGDYNPDQWPESVRQDDIRLMKLSRMNVMCIGIFSWSQLEPEPGRYEWEWLDRAFDGLYGAGVHVGLATPSAAHPKWLTAMHPEVMAVSNMGKRRLHSHRQCFCPTAPVYRRHVARINRALAGRYGRHPGLVLWHVSNEYDAHCYCDLCADAFRDWLCERYGTLEALNHEWWTAFWGQRVSDWSEIIPPVDHSYAGPNGLALDWMRFHSHQVCDFFKREVAVLKEITPGVPVTTNLMGTWCGLDYAKFADVMDVISWDSYPEVGGDPGDTAFSHAMMRGLKGNMPWLLIEQTPSVTNWQEYATLKPPGLMRLWSWQAVGHGSDSAMFFQWRRSRGGGEKFHGAVVEHAGSERARVFSEVSALGAEFKAVSDRVVGTRVGRARVGVIWDQENRWAIECSCGPGRDKRYVATVQKHYRAIWRSNVAVDVIRMDADWSQYDMIIAPMLYMVKSGRYPLKGVPEEMKARLDERAKIADWVADGGTFVATYLSGIVNESDLVYEGGYPGPLRKLMGIWVEEIDNSDPGKNSNSMVMERDVFIGAGGSYGCARYFDLLETEGAEVLARYGSDWYAGKPCLTRNRFGKGAAYYIATDAEDKFLADFYFAIAEEKGIRQALISDVDVEVIERIDGERSLIFVLNHADGERSFDLGARVFAELLSGSRLTGNCRIGPRGVMILEAAQ